MIANPQNDAQRAFNEGGKMPVTLTHDLPGIGAAGQTVLLALTPADVQESTEDPSYLAGYSNAEFRADEMSPVVMKDKDFGKYRRFTEDSTFQRVHVKGSQQGAIPEVDVGTKLDDYQVEDRFLGGFIPAITESQSTAFSARRATLRRCANAILLDREIDVCNMLSTQANWDSSVRALLTGTTKWNGGASADPIGDIQARLEASLGRVTDAYMNLRVANVFLRNATVKDWFKQWVGDGAVDGTVRNVNTSIASSATVDFTIPGIPVTFHVCASKVKDDATGLIDYILPNHVIMVRKPPSGQPRDGEDMATSYTFRRKGAAGVGYMTREFRVEGRGPQGGTMVVVSQADIAKMVGPKIGGFIENVVQ